MKKDDGKEDKKEKDLKKLLEKLGLNEEGDAKNPLGDVNLEFGDLLAELDEILMMADTAIAIGEEAAKKVKPRIIKAIKLLLNSGIDIHEELGPEVEKFSVIKAKNRYRYYSNLIAAGFKKEEAFKLLLAEIKPISFNEQIAVKAVKKAISEVKIKK